MKITIAGMDRLWTLWESNKGNKGLYPRTQKLSRRKMTRIRLRETVQQFLESVETTPTHIKERKQLRATTNRQNCNIKEEK